MTERLTVGDGGGLRLRWKKGPQTNSGRHIRRATEVTESLGRSETTDSHSPRDPTTTPPATSLVRRLCLMVFTIIFLSALKPQPLPSRSQ